MRTTDRCDPEIYEHGTSVFVTDTIDADAMEVWVRLIAERSRQRVDWRSGCGRSEVFALGDLDAVEAAIEKLLPIHDLLFAEAVRNIWVDEARREDCDRHPTPPPRHWSRRIKPGPITIYGSQHNS